MRVLNYVLLFAATSVAVTACDSESSGSLPTSASPTTSSIAVYPCGNGHGNVDATGRCW